MATFTTQTLAEALADVGRSAPVVTQAYARHQAYLADIAHIGRQHAEAVKTAPGYSHALGCFYSPKDAVAFVDAQLDAARGASALQMAAE